MSSSTLEKTRPRWTPTALAARHPWTTIAAFALVTAVAAVGLGRLRETDDVLEFIPPSDPDVKVFNDVNAKFGALRVALIGVEARAGDDVFAPETLGRMERATEALKSVHGVDRVLSLSSLVDFAPAEGAVQVVPLVPELPRSAAERAALKARVLSREHVVGSFVSPDGRAALMLVFLAPPKPGTQVSLRRVAHELHQAAETAFAGTGLRMFYGGAPFAAATIFEETQEDARRLTPLAMLCILLVIVLAFRDPVGVALTVITVGWAVVVVLGAMGFLDEPYTVVSATLPVILFASGSSYAVHLLGRYYALGGRDGGPGVVEAAAEVVTPSVVIATCTTAAGFLSFVVMDIRPMRTFGVECAAGVFLCLLATLFLVPAVVTLWPRRAAQPAQLGRVGEALTRVGLWAARSRRWLLVGSGVAALATVGPMLEVEVRMEPHNFFRPGSEPWLAERFLDERFGGSQFLQVSLAGDLTDPATLREVQRLAAFARAQPGVTQVSSMLSPLELVSDAMGLGRGLPETRGQALNLLFFIEGEPSLRNLLTLDRHEALLHLRVRGDAQPAMQAMERYLESRHLDVRLGGRRPGAPTGVDVAERMGWILKAAGVNLPAEQMAGMVRSLRSLPTEDAELIEARRQAALAVLRGEGGILEPIADRALAERIAGLAAQAVSSPGAPRQAVDEGKRALGGALPSPEDVEAVWPGLDERVRDADRRHRASRAIQETLGTQPGSPKNNGPQLPDAVAAELRETLLDLLPLQTIGTAPTPLVARLAGEPVLERGLSRSVAKNQTRSLVVSLVAVLGLIYLLFRSLRLAAVSVYPSALTMAILFGVMGLSGMRIDIGTSLVASIATGAGSDFAMHYLWYLRRSTHEEVARFVGPIMVISTLLVAFGFAILGFGKAQPMRLFGFLAAAAMALAAGLTFVLVPALVGEPGESGASTKLTGPEQDGAESKEKLS
jgi:predicted RND superfamily exporter protein